MSVSSLSSPSSTPAEDSPNYKAMLAEREANARILAAAELIQRTELANNTALEQLRDRFENSYNHQKLKDDETLEKQKTEGYANLRNAQRFQQNDLHGIQRQGAADKDELELYLRNSLRDLEAKGKREITEEMSQRNQILEFEKSSGNTEIEAAQGKHTEQMQQIRDENTHQIDHILAENQATIEQLKERTVESKEKTQNDTAENLKQFIQQQQVSISDLYNQANQKLEELRRSTSQKLTAYATRQSDPFYKLINLDAHLKDEGDAFVLTASIPEYEQEHISATIQGNNISIAGYRRNEETARDASGHVQGTSAYQGFHENFPLSWPVDAKKLSRIHVGDQVIVRVPKLNSLAFKEPVLVKVEKARIEQPHFPKNLPILKGQEDVQGQE